MFEKVNVDIEGQTDNQAFEAQRASDPESHIHFQGGILGFPTITNYLLIAYEEGRSFFRLQAEEQPDLGFVVIDPLSFSPDYRPEFSRAELESLEITHPESMVILSIVSIPKDAPGAMTANLMAPLVINARLRKGKQIVLSNSEYAIREAIIQTD